MHAHFPAPWLPCYISRSTVSTASLGLLESWPPFINQCTALTLVMEIYLQTKLEGRYDVYSGSLGCYFKGSFHHTPSHPDFPCPTSCTARSLEVKIEDGLPRENQLSGVQTFLARFFCSVYRCQLAHLQTGNLSNIENKVKKWSVTREKAQELVLCFLLKQYS